MAWICELYRLFLLLQLQFELLGVLEVLALRWNLWHKRWCWIVLQVGEFGTKGAPNVLGVRLWAACQGPGGPTLPNKSLSERGRDNSTGIMLVCMSLIDDSFWCLLLLILMRNGSWLLLMLCLLLHHCLFEYFEWFVLSWIWWMIDDYLWLIISQMKLNFSCPQKYFRITLAWKLWKIK